MKKAVKLTALPKNARLSLRYLFGGKEVMNN